jgi:hypothetical protein
MIDCYRVLGVSPRASQAEIRAAYIGRMKVLHPDAGRVSNDAAAAAGEITAAYWQVRTPERRKEHDRRLFASTSVAGAGHLPPAPRRGWGAARAARQPPGPRRGNGVSQILWRTAVAIVILALAAPAGLFWFAYLNPIEAARASASVGSAAAAAAAETRRPLDAAMRAAAADDFATVLQDLGPAGASGYSRRCLTELSARASMTMLDYCVAFDDAAANWERRYKSRPRSGPSPSSGAPPPIARRPRRCGTRR